MAVAGPWLLAFGLLLGACGRTEKRPEGRVAVDAAGANRACVRCHRDIAAEWAGSQHHRSADAVFRAAWEREPQRFCEECHAPLARRSAEVFAAQGKLGIACVTCHAVGGGEAGVPAERLPAAHPAVAKPQGTAACGGCHEFAFPGVRERAELFQATLSEQAESPYAGAGCSGCHMPPTPSPGGGRHASHAFAGSRVAEAQSAAVQVVAERSGPSRLRLSLSSRGVGHAYPTGDLFRRIAVRVEARGHDFAVPARAETFLARHFVDVRTGRQRFERRVTLDDRLRPGVPRVVELTLPSEAASLLLAYEVKLERVLHENPNFEGAAQIESSELLARGVVEP